MIQIAADHAAPFQPASLSPADFQGATNNIR
jgi:hypothetical protein